MASAEYKHSILWRGEDPTKTRFKPTYDGTKRVERYRPGQVPVWVEEGKKAPRKGREPEKEKPEEDLRKAKRRRQAAAVVLEASDTASSRLARLQRSETVGEAGEPSAARLPRQRRVEEAVILEEKDEKKDEKLELLKEEVDVDLKPGVAELNYDEIVGSGDEDVEIQAVRREKARELALSKRKIEEDVLKAELEEEQEEVDEEESEYESESEENDDRRGPLMKPVFVSKANRETVREKEQIEKEEEEARRKKEVRQLERKAESKVLLIDRINEEAEAARLAEELDDRSDIELMDDDDEKNEAEEYELWKIRELKRIKRDKEEKLKRQEEIAFVLRRREMTDEERARDDAKLDAANPKKADVKQFNFLQKYYHRGGFFQDKAVSGEEALYLRDYHEPLEEEKYDKQLLPKAMQLRRGEFGKKGQVKHSHLTDVDTTDMSAAWAQSSKIVQRYQEKMAAAKGVGGAPPLETSKQPTQGFDSVSFIPLRGHASGQKQLWRAFACQASWHDVSACQVGYLQMAPPNRSISLSIISLLTCGASRSYAADLTVQQSCQDADVIEGSCSEASFLQHGLEVQQVLDAAKSHAAMQPATSSDVAANISNVSNLTAHASNATAVQPALQKEQQDKEPAVLLNQLVAASLARESSGSSSIVSTVVNLVVLVMLVLLIALLCRHDMNVQEAYEEVKGDPQMLYKQFEQDVSPRARCTQERRCAATVQDKMYRALNYLRKMEPEELEMLRNTTLGTRVVEGCTLRAAISGVGGAGLGLLMGGFLHTMQPPPNIDTSLSTMEQIRQSYKGFGQACVRMSRNFAKVGVVFAGVECFFERERACRDLPNAILSGCVTGGVLAFQGGPTGMALGCAGFAAFSGVIETLMDH
ncbi:mfap-1 [Symbiodinium sp. KB8]|nr:mfap-1 [Symbiodinium sp. KB8]